MKGMKMKRKEVLVHVSPRIARWLVALRLGRYSKMGKRTAKVLPASTLEQAQAQEMVR